MIYTASVTAAVAVVGANVVANERWARSPVNRALTSAAYTGSAVIGDSEVDIYIDEVRVSGLFNSALLVPQVDRDMVPMGALFVPAGAELQVVVLDAAATSPVFFAANFEQI